MSGRPLVAAAVINYNGAAFLKACLDRVNRQTVRPDEILVIYNASHDGSAELVRETFPRLRLICFDRNLGYAAAANRAVRETHARYILLLNADTALTPTFVEELVRAAESRPEVGSLTG